VVAATSVLAVTSGHELRCAISEFKGDDTSSGRYEAYGKMVKAGTDCTVELLINGMMVEKIIVYGLLVSIDKSKALPLKYTVEFNIESGGFSTSTFCYGNESVPLLLKYCSV